jgi:sodium-dependent phosphate cotransporter
MWRGREPRVPESALLLAAATGTVLLFLFAVQLLGAATEAAAPALERFLERVVVGDAPALGLSWVAAYVLANGSVVAALALSLFGSGLLSVSQLFLMIAGSRLGAAAIVVVVGALDYLQKDRYAIQEAVSLGLLTFLVTHSVYLPVTAVGYLAQPVLGEPFRAVGDGIALGVRPLGWFEPVTAAVTALVGPALAFGLAVALLFGSMHLFDRLLGRVDTETIREYVFAHFEQPWLSFAIGLAVTMLTTSVAFSLGVIVPLYNRGYVERAELLPYVLGANLGTLLDTLVVAIVLETAVGTATVLFLLAVATLLTLLALLFHRRYAAVVERVHGRLVDDRRAFVAFLASLVLAPLALLVVPLVLA